MNLGVLFSGPDLAAALMPEWILLIGIVAMIVIPNLGNGTFRLPIPGYSIRVPYLLGGKRFAFTNDPRLPAGIAGFTLLAAFVTAFMSQMVDSSIGIGHACLEANGAIDISSNCAAARHNLAVEGGRGVFSLKQGGRKQILYGGARLIRKMKF